jgi:xylulokinase
MLPGDFISMKLTGQVTTSISALSEGIFWDFQSNSISQDVMQYFGFSENIIPRYTKYSRNMGGYGKMLRKASGLKPVFP